MTVSKINLLNDYNSVAHERIFDALHEYLGSSFEGYGADQETEEAKTAMKRLVKNPHAEIHFLAGGTLTNLISLSAFLRPHEAVIAPCTAHISVHETGAIEATGHKVLMQNSPDGKVRPEDIVGCVSYHADEHMVKPRLLYISQTTEFVSIYSRAELEALRVVCDEYDLLMYIDGARLPYALSQEGSDIDLPLIAQLADAFYLGGTKNGLLFGEALVICNPALSSDFRYLIKQRGGLFAKGFLLGIQFKTYLEDGLYLKLAAQANNMAAKLTAGLKELGYDLEIETETNQVFPIVDSHTAASLHDYIEFEEWHKLEQTHTSIRFVTTWKTSEEDIHTTLELMKKAGSASLV